MNFPADKMTDREFAAIKPSLDAMRIARWMTRQMAETFGLPASTPIGDLAKQIQAILDNPPPSRNTKSDRLTAMTGMTEDQRKGAW